MLGYLRGKEIFGYTPDYTVFDLETTGLDPEQDAVVEIGAVKVRDHKIVTEFRALVNPERDIPEDVIKLHGITEQMVANAPKIAEALYLFNIFIGKDILVGQNIGRFDLPFIWRFSNIHYGRYISNDYIDNLTTARKAHPELEHHHLRDLCEMYQIRRDVAHRALNDCRATYEVFEILSRKAYSDEIFNERSDNE